MSETDSIEIANRRLALALDALEAAAERRQESDRSEEALAAQIHALDTDRCAARERARSGERALARVGDREPRGGATDRAGDRNHPRSTGA